jgi:ribosomal protein S12 methylthiotransferase
VIPLMAEGKILPYLDIPLQHASPDVLRAMKRPGDVEGMLARIDKWRAICPDLTIRSTFITGFPGESEVDFELLLDFLREAQLDRVGCFAYSPVEGATANALPGAVPEEVKEERRARLMALQEEISAARLERRIGQRITVLVDEIDEEGAVARSAADAPEIDGLVFIEEAEGLQAGDFVEVEVVDADAHDMWAEPV